LLLLKLCSNDSGSENSNPELALCLIQYKTDNGCEFVNQKMIETIVIINKNRTIAYYAHPYSSWERGSNENTNKIIRRFIPKGADISNYTVKEIKRIEDWINNYSRRILKYKIAKEIYEAT
jgi:IS30 family transposase